MGEAGGLEQAIAFAKGKVEHFAQSKHRLTAGLGPTGFNKTDMPHRKPSPAGQLELAQPPRLPPGADPRPNRFRCICHARILFTARKSTITSQVIVGVAPAGLTSRHEKTICAEIDDSSPC
jgi:hypothetical protein